MSEIDRIKELQKMSQQELIEIILKLEKDKVHNERGAGRKSKFNKEQRKQQLPQQEEKKEKVGEDETPPLP